MPLTDTIAARLHRGGRHPYRLVGEDRHGSYLDSACFEEEIEQEGPKSLVESRACCIER
jgi:hypothetical protein